MYFFGVGKKSSSLVSIPKRTQKIPQDGVAVPMVGETPRDFGLVTLVPLLAVATVSEENCIVVDIKKYFFLN